MLTRKQIEAEYAISEAGTIESPGKFEGEMIYAPYFYDFLLDGGADDDVDGVASFTVNKEDRVEFPELAGVSSILIEEDEQGFIWIQEVA